MALHDEMHSPLMSFWQDKAVEACLGGQVGVWVSLKAVTGLWNPRKVKVEVLKAVEKPGSAWAQWAGRT